MRIRQKRVVSCFEVVLLILSSFAIAFILEENLASGQTDVSPFEFEGGRVSPPGTSPALPTAINPTQAASFWTIDAGKEIAGGTYYSGTITDGTNIWQIASADKPLTISSSGGKTIVAHEGKFWTLKEGTTLTAQTAVQGDLGIKANFGIWNPEINFFGSQASNFFTAHLLEGVVWGGIIALAIKFLGPTLGLSEKQSNAAALATFGAITSGKLVYGLIGPKGALAIPKGAFLTSAAIGLAIGITIFILTYKKEKKKLVSFECLPFEPPLGGEKCEECNKDPFRPCSEYRCRSLGQACQLLNPGTAEEKCAWVSPKDAISPTIEPWKDALKPAGLQYIPDNSIRPPNRGVKVVTQNKNGCLQAFTPLEFGITTNEPAQCKIDYNHTAKFDNMLYYMGGSNYHRYNHTEKLKLPGPDSTIGNLAPELKNDGFFSLFVRCRDANGNANVDEFVFNFCVDPSADTTPPIIEGTSIISGSPIRNDAEQVPIQVYVNEPAECKWSRQSKNYEDMENSMECATETFQINADLNYVCSSNLTITEKGAGTENKFYFRCKDQPNKPDNERNVMIQSHELVLKGSQKLNIIETKPNETIFGSTDVVRVNLEVKTDDGAEEGKAICYLSDSGEEDSFIAMSETNSFMHKQPLDFIGGNYKFFFRCIDKGGNTAEAVTAFNVFIDKTAPIVTRAYKEEGLKIVTNEDAECVYSLNSCNYEFSEGLPLIYSNPSLKKNHFAEWKANGIYYIKCKDLYENKPSPNECSIVASAVELGGKK